MRSAPSVSSFTIPSLKKQKAEEDEKRAALLVNLRNRRALRVRDARRALRERSSDSAVQTSSGPISCLRIGSPAAYHQVQPRWVEITRRRDLKRIPALQEIQFYADFSIVPGVALAEAFHGYGLDDPSTPGIDDPNQEFLFVLHWPGLFEDIAKVYSFHSRELRTTGRIAQWVAYAYSSFFAQKARVSQINLAWGINGPLYPDGVRFDQLRLVRLYTLDGRIWHTDMIVSMAERSALKVARPID
ncbi:hypothetical protein EWM64_g2238 [Hericium alpestre]|uniref:Uncharacterized protein n=1 Tax=Hericium alpestre TaxID=135208 RepID=A0A4Z0A5Q0_9AGAM|nr:hypothetical protein EWM64_g2238 [Hericium alpestre]